MKAARAAFLLALALALSACGEEPLAEVRYLMGDDYPAAPRVHLPTVPLQGPSRLGSRPVRTVTGTARPAIGHVAGATRMADGRLVIADGHTNEIHGISPSGELEWSRGGDGMGPGRFEFINGFFRVGGDTIAVRDGGARESIELLTGRGWPRAVIPLPGHITGPVGRLDGGDWIFRVSSVGRAARGSSVRVDTAAIIAFRPESGTVDTLLIVPRARQFLFYREGDPSSREGERSSWMWDPFRPTRLMVAVCGDWIYAASGARPEVVAFDADGTPARVFTGIGSTREIRPADIEHYTEKTRELWIRRHPGFPFDADRMPPVRATTMPAFTDFLIDRAGRFWIRPFATPFGSRYQVIDPSSRAFLGEVRLPQDSRILEAGADYVLTARLAGAAQQEVVEEWSLEWGDALPEEGYCPGQ